MTGDGWEQSFSLSDIEHGRSDHEHRRLRPDETPDLIDEQRRRHPR